MTILCLLKRISLGNVQTNMRDITNQIKQAIAIDALWSVSDFFYLLERFREYGLKSHWEEGEHCTGFSYNDEVIGYIWKRYPLIFIKEDYTDGIKEFIGDLDYIVFIQSKDLVTEEFTIDMDDELRNCIFYLLDKKSFSANDFWFYMVTW